MAAVGKHLCSAYNDKVTPEKNDIFVYGVRYSSYKLQRYHEGVVSIIK